MMDSELATARVKDEGLSEKVRSFEQHPSKPCNVKGLPPSAIKNKNVDLLEKVGALKTEKLPRQTAKDQPEAKRNSDVLPSWTSQKPWPSRKATSVDEPVKNMSNVPHYLQRTDKGDNIHEKALNYGVLDWGLLEKWAHSQKGDTDVGVRNTVSSSMDSFSTGFPHKSCRTMSASPSQRKKSRSMRPQKRHPVAGSLRKKSEKENCGQFKGFCDSRECSTKFPRHDRSSSNVSNWEVMSHEVCPARYTTGESIATRPAKEQNISSKAKLSKNHSDRPMASDKTWFSQDDKMKRDCHYSDSQLTTGGRITERNCNNLSGNLAEDFEITHQYTHIPHTCLLPSTTISDEPHISCALPPKNVEQTEKSTCRKVDQLFSRASCTTEDPKKYGAKAMDAAEKKLSDCPSYAGFKRMDLSSTLRGSSSKGQSDSVSCLHNLHGGQAIKTNKDRQSPLRRILDPLLKPMNNLVLHGRHSCELSGTYKSSHALPKSTIKSVDDPTHQSMRSMGSSNQLPDNSKATNHDESHNAPGRPMNHAILQFAWKNGLPLLMLSSNDTEVLAATLTTRIVSNNDELRYKIFSLKDSKKKGMFWSNYGNKAKKHQFISNVVAQLRVSLHRLSYDFDKFHVVREFVLLGAELAPTSPKPVDLPIKSELAAIVVKVPLQRPKTLSIGMLYRSKCKGSSPTNSEEKTSASNEDKDLKYNQFDDVTKQPGIVVIIPSGIHGLSNDGEPSPLLERWRSGGACDCGGWDEGCKLTILSDMFQNCSITGSAQDCSTQRFDLFIQGASKEKSHAFSMVPFREGQYAVDFLSSMSLLQAFAICIAFLHGVNPSNHSAESKSLQEHIVDGQLGRDPGRISGDATSYVPNHPPLSPVGRV